MYSMLENLPDVLYDVYHRRLARILKAFHLSKHFISQSMAPRKRPAAAPVSDGAVGDMPLTQRREKTRETAAPISDGAFEELVSNALRKRPAMAVDANASASSGEAPVSDGALEDMTFGQKFKRRLE